MASLCTCVNSGSSEKCVISIVGSGDWGFAIAKLLACNVKGNTPFNEKIRMYTESEAGGRKPTSSKIPENVVATTDLSAACKDADLLIFVLPAQLVQSTCQKMAGAVKKSAVAVSFIRCFVTTDTGFQLVSEIITKTLGIECAVVAGANTARDVISGQFCEATIGSRRKDVGLMLKQLLETPCFRCTVVQDAGTVEACGPLVKVVAIGAGVVEALKYGDNTKAAYIRIGLMEMIKICELIIPGSQNKTFFESCAAGDLIGKCHGSPSCKLGEHLAKSSKTVAQLEAEVLEGKPCDGPLIAEAICKVLEKKKDLHLVPLFEAVHLLCQRQLDPHRLIDSLANHPEHK